MKNSLAEYLNEIDGYLAPEKEVIIIHPEKRGPAEDTPSSDQKTERKLSLDEYIFEEWKNIKKILNSESKLSQVDKNLLNNFDTTLKQRVPKKSKTSQVYFIGVSDHVKNIMEEIKHASKAVEYKQPVIILGETGTGKGNIAHLIHKESNLNNKKMFSINCASFPHNLIESELFGHEKGAFTGAYELKKGFFEAAQEGIVFLDEIGELPLSLQAKLLKVLSEEEKKIFYRIGSTKGLHFKGSLISATNKNLEKEILDGSFRNDLYYRLGVIIIKTLPLRKHKEDIPSLIKHFITKYSKRFNIKTKISITKEAQQILMNYNYPGNVRELESFIKNALIISKINEETELTEKYFSTLQNYSNNNPGSNPVNNPGNNHVNNPANNIAHTLETDGNKENHSYNTDYFEVETIIILDNFLNNLKNYVQYITSGKNKRFRKNWLDVFDKLLIEAVIKISSNNKSKAAKLLGFTKPQALYNKIKELKKRLNGNK